MIPQLVGMIWVSFGYRVRICFRKFAEYLFAYHIITNLEFLGGPTNGIQKVSIPAEDREQLRRGAFGGLLDRRLAAERPGVAAVGLLGSPQRIDCSCRGGNKST